MRVNGKSPVRWHDDGTFAWRDVFEQPEEKPGLSETGEELIRIAVWCFVCGVFFWVPVTIIVLRWTGLL